MTALRFVDTNILVYAATGRTDASRKQSVVEALLASEPIGLSAQVLQEFYTTVTREGAPPLSSDQARVWIERLARFPVVDIDARLVKAAIALSQRFRISYWDAAIVAAAERLGATVVYTEDLSHGQAYGAVRAVNPFLDA